MLYFLGGIALLIIGYFVYGAFVEKILRPDDRKTPCVANPDGVDLLPLPLWKNMLIQLLNIAGIGPVIGVILGIKFGKIALLLIPIGCILMGAVHDYAAGMMSLRMNGANLPKIVEKYLGKTYASVFSWAMLILLLLVVAVFINVPAKLVSDSIFSNQNLFWCVAICIFIYYIAATLFPVDKIIGRVYPLFGALLILGSLAMFVSLLVFGFKDATIFNDCQAFSPFKEKNPIFPCLFVTIACGIISGFHATQCPIVARTMIAEKEAKLTFFGMMVAEGVIAMIWAQAALAIYNLEPNAITQSGPVVLGVITNRFLGSWMGVVTILAIIVLAITSGDTALRSARLSIGEMFDIDQVPIRKRIFTSLPLIGAVVALLMWSNGADGSFKKLWNYFAWGNQLLSATALMTASAWLLSLNARFKVLVTLLPGMFMTAVVTTFILWTPGTEGHPVGIVPGGLGLVPSILCGVTISILFAAFVVYRGRKVLK